MIIDKETYFAQDVAVTNDTVKGATIVDLIKAGQFYKLAGFLVVLIKEAFAAAGAIDEVEVNAAGSDYTVNDVLTIAGGTGGTVKVKTVDTGGEVLTIELVTPGSGYSAATGAATTGGTGTGCKITTTLVGGGSAPGTAVEFQLAVADEKTLTTNNTVIMSTGALPLANLTVGAMVALPLPANFSREFVGVQAVPTGDFVAGKFDAFITMDVPMWY